MHEPLLMPRVTSYCQQLDIMGGPSREYSIQNESIKGRLPRSESVNRTAFSAGFGIKFMRHHSSHAKGRPDKLLEYANDQVAMNPWAILLRSTRRASVIAFPSVVKGVISCMITSSIFLMMSCVLEKAADDALQAIGATISAGLFFLLGPCTRGTGATHPPHCCFHTMLVSRQQHVDPEPMSVPLTRAMHTPPRSRGHQSGPLVDNANGLRWWRVGLRGGLEYLCERLLQQWLRGRSGCASTGHEIRPRRPSAAVYGVRHTRACIGTRAQACMRAPFGAAHACTRWTMHMHMHALGMHRLELPLPNQLDAT